MITVCAQNYQLENFKVGPPPSSEKLMPEIIPKVISRNIGL